MRLWVASAALAAAALVLGGFVARRPPGAVDRDGAAFRGHAVRLAIFFTRLGRWPVLLSLGVVAFGIAMVLRERLTPVVVVLGAQVASQAANGALKVAFRRVRPDAWLHVREPDLSYPSGHAASAMVFFLGFGVLGWEAPLPRPIDALLCAALLVPVLGIPWSRLALRAHYVSDVIGGLCLGGAFLCAALATIVHLTLSAAIPA